jgi:hypothetical protein
MKLVAWAATGNIELKKYTQIDEDELVAESVTIREKGLKAVAIIGVYSPLDRNDVRNALKTT